MELTPRIRQIILYLLNAEQPATDSEVADALGVSKRTILREADYISAILKGYDLIKKREESSLNWNCSETGSLKNSFTTATCSVSAKPP